MAATIRTAIYARCSTVRLTGSISRTQLPALTQLAAARGLDVVGVFEEHASTVKHRPEWERLKIAAHRGESKAVVIFAIDRLGRSMVGNVQEILDLDRLGVEVVSVREPWLDTGGPVLRTLLIAIFNPGSGRVQVAYGDGSGEAQNYDGNSAVNR